MRRQSSHVPAVCAAAKGRNFSGLHGWGMPSALRHRFRISPVKLGQPRIASAVRSALVLAGERRARGWRT